MVFPTTENSKRTFLGTPYEAVFLQQNKCPQPNNDERLTQEHCQHEWPPLYLRVFWGIFSPWCSYSSISLNNINLRHSQPLFHYVSSNYPHLSLCKLLCVISIRGKYSKHILCQTLLRLKNHEKKRLEERLFDNLLIQLFLFRIRLNNQQTWYLLSYIEAKYKFDWTFRNFFETTQKRFCFWVSSYASLIIINIYSFKY